MKVLLIILSVVNFIVMFAYEKAEIEPFRSWLNRKMEKGDQRFFNMINTGSKALLLHYAKYFERIFMLNFVLLLAVFLIQGKLGIKLENIFLLSSIVFLVSFGASHGLKWFLNHGEQLRKVLKNPVFWYLLAAYIGLFFWSHYAQVKLSYSKPLNQLFLGELYWVWSIAIPAFFLLMIYLFSWIGSFCVVVCIGLPLYIFQVLLFILHENFSKKLTLCVLAMLEAVFMVIFAYL